MAVWSDFTLEWTPNSAPPPSPDSPAAAAEPIGPTVLQALRDQLGLKVESARVPVPILVFDRIDRPSEDSRLVL